MYGFSMETTLVLLEKPALHRREIPLHNRHCSHVRHNVLGPWRQNVSKKTQQIQDFQDETKLLTDQIRIFCHLQENDTGFIQCNGFNVHSCSLPRITKRRFSATSRQRRKNCLLPRTSRRNVLRHALCFRSGTKTKHPRE